MPFAATATLAGSWQLAIVMLAFLIFFCTCAVGAAPAGLQLVTPNRFRAQASAVYMLVLNMIASGAGPALTALATDYVFMDTAAVGKSLALVSGCSAPIAVLIFAVGLRSFRHAVEALESR